MLKITFLVFFGFLTLGYAYLYRYPVNPGNPNVCYNPETNEKMKPGEDAFIMAKCEKITCLGQHGMTVAGCGAVSADASHGCYVTERDYTKQYPNCCPKIKCNG